MSHYSIKERLATGCRWIAGLFQTQVRELRCTSILGGKTLHQPDLILRAAEEAQIAFTIQYSAASFFVGRHGCPLEITARTKSPEGCAASPMTWRVEQWRNRRKVCVSVRFNPQTLAGQERLEISIRESGRLLTTLSVQVVDEAQAQRLRVRELRTVEQQLWVQSGEQRYCCENIIETTALLIPEITLAGAELNAVLPAWEACLSLSLVSGNTRIPLGDTQFRLGADQFRIKARPISIKDNPILRNPGRYQLMAAVAERELAVFPFRMAGKTEWRDQLKVTPMLEAESADGQISRETGALDWSRHAGLIPSLRIQTAIPAPNTPINCVISIQLEEKVIHREAVVVRLTQYSNEVRLHQFSLSELRKRSGGKRVSLLLTVDLEKERKASRPVVILPAGSVANFEGQLNSDVSTIPLDEDAYERILSSLVENRTERKWVRRASTCQSGDRYG